MDELPTFCATSNTSLNIVLCPVPSGLPPDWDESAETCRHADLAPTLLPPGVNVSAQSSQLFAPSGLASDKENLLIWVMSSRVVRSWWLNLVGCEGPGISAQWALLFRAP